MNSEKLLTENTYFFNKAEHYRHFTDKDWTLMEIQMPIFEASRQAWVFQKWTSVSSFAALLQLSPSCPCGMKKTVWDPHLQNKQPAHFCGCRQPSPPTTVFRDVGLLWLISPEASICLKVDSLVAFPMYLIRAACSFRV